MNYYLDPILKHYIDFSGRTPRKAFWLFMLFHIIIYIVLSIIDAVSGMYSLEMGIGVLSTIYVLAVFIPVLAIQIRRLRDAGFNPWLYLLILIPLVGAIAIIVMWCLPTKHNQISQS